MEKREHQKKHNHNLILRNEWVASKKDNNVFEKEEVMIVFLKFINKILKPYIR
jgi:hypothetical protein